VQNQAQSLAQSLVQSLAQNQVQSQVQSLAQGRAILSLLLSNQNAAPLSFRHWLQLPAHLLLHVVLLKLRIKSALALDVHWNARMTMRIATPTKQNTRFVSDYSGSYCFEYQCLVSCKNENVAPMEKTKF